MFCAAEDVLLYKYGAAIVTLVLGSKRSVAMAENVKRSLVCLHELLNTLLRHKCKKCETNMPKPLIKRGNCMRGNEMNRC
jgi:hypothetical protein